MASKPTYEELEERIRELDSEQSRHAAALRLLRESQGVISPQYCVDHPGASPGSFATLSVSDTGCGMPADSIKKIFDPFYTTKEPGRGTGLGLATVYGIVKQNGGFIEVSSEAGAGSTFRLYFPRQSGTQCVDPETEKLEARPSGSETILFVEDELSIRDPSTLYLETLGYTVLSAESPQVALALAAQHEGTIDALITDVIMPGMNGRILAARMREGCPGIKVLYISGYTGDAMAQRGVGARLDADFLPKPFPLKALAAKVRSILEADG